MTLVIGTLTTPVEPDEALKNTDVKGLVPEPDDSVAIGSRDAGDERESDGSGGFDDCGELGDDGASEDCDAGVGDVEG